MTTIGARLMDQDELDELEERAAIIADGCGVSQERATAMALEQAEAERKRLLGKRAWTQGLLL